MSTPKITTTIMDPRIAGRAENIHITVQKTRDERTGAEQYTASVHNTPYTATKRTEEQAIAAVRQEWREKCQTLGPQAAGQISII